MAVYTRSSYHSSLVGEIPFSGKKPRESSYGEQVLRSPGRPPLEEELVQRSLRLFQRHDTEAQQKCEREGYSYSGAVRWMLWERDELKKEVQQLRLRLEMEQLPLPLPATVTAEAFPELGVEDDQEHAEAPEATAVSEQAEAPELGADETQELPEPRGGVRLGWRLPRKQQPAPSDAWMREYAARALALLQSLQERSPDPGGPRTPKVVGAPPWASRADLEAYTAALAQMPGATDPAALRAWREEWWRRREASLREQRRALLVERHQARPPKPEPPPAVPPPVPKRARPRRLRIFPNRN